jgi:hypothetical protein
MLPDLGICLDKLDIHIKSIYYKHLAKNSWNIVSTLSNVQKYFTFFNALWKNFSVRISLTPHFNCQPYPTLTPPYSPLSPRIWLLSGSRTFYVIIPLGYLVPRTVFDPQKVVEIITEWRLNKGIKEWPVPEQANCKMSETPRVQSLYDLGNEHPTFCVLVTFFPHLTKLIQLS